MYNSLLFADVLAYLIRAIPHTVMSNSLNTRIFYIERTTWLFEKLSSYFCGIRALLYELYMITKNVSVL